MAKGASLHRLNLSESRVVRLVAEGLSDEQIAERLGVSIVTVGADLAEVLRKLGLRSRTELALLAPERRQRDAKQPGNGTEVPR